VKIELSQLNAWAQLAQQTNNRLVHLMFLLGRPNVTPANLKEAASQATEGQGLNNRLLQELLCAGADDPNRPRAGMPARKETGLAVMTSPANRRLASLLRETAQAAADVEAERGEDGGLSEILTSYAEQAEMEVYGPAGLGKDERLSPPLMENRRVATADKERVKARRAQRVPAK